MTDNILGGLGEFFRQNSCDVHYFLENTIPYIRAKRHRAKGHVECQVIDGKLRMLFQRGNNNFLKNWDKMGKPRGVPAAHPTLPNHGTEIIDLINPNSLEQALAYINKHLIPRVRVKGWPKS